MLLLLSALLLSSADAFAPHRPSCRAPASINLNNGVAFVRRFSSNSDDDVPQPGTTTSGRKRRVRRKQIPVTEIILQTEEVEEEDQLIIANKADMVEFEIKDVRDIVNPTASLGTTTSANSAYDDDYDDEEEFDESDSLKKLLADAKRMRGDVAKDGEDEGGLNGLNDKIKNAISLVVAADFFLILALLVWFLAGIFCSYVLRNDTVQIAFNGIFQPVVQPALGILMFGGLGSCEYSTS